MLSLRAPLTAALAALAAGGLLLPARAPGYATNGSSLGLAQRDLRVYASFSAAGANANALADACFPGSTGAALAIRKAAAEWGSELHGWGAGDPHQPGGLGSGGANFDASWQGLANGPGAANDNVCSQIAGSSPGVYAYCELPSSDGWRIRFYENWSWDDGPEVGLPNGATDLQAVATHEYGHALGLGHSNNASATMTSSGSGTLVWMRSIESDDRAGIQAIYGAKSSSKARILGLTVGAGTLRIEGANFAPSGNTVWFTQRASGGNGDPVQVGGLASTLGGTRIELAIPPSAGPGDVLVKSGAGSGGAQLSNAWPIDPDVPGTSGGAPLLSGLAPASIATVLAAPLALELHGSGLAATSSVLVGGQALAPSAWSVIGDDALALTLAGVHSAGPLSIAVAHALGTSPALSLEVVAPDPPALALSNAILGSSSPALLSIGAPAGSLSWLLVSPDFLPSALPGLFELAIGNQLQSLYLVATLPIGAPGWTQLALPISGLSFGTALHFQALCLRTSAPELPLHASNAVHGTFYY